MQNVWGRVRPMVFRTIIGAVIAAGLVGVFAVLVGDFGIVAVQLLLTILVVIVFALLSWYDADVSSQRSGAFALASVATSLYLLIAGFAKIWIVRPDLDGAPEVWTVWSQFGQWIGLALVARAALLHVHLLLIIHRRFPTPVLQVVAKVTVGVIAVLALLVSLPILFPAVHWGEGYWRFLWVVAILDLLGTVIVPLSNALFRPRHPAPSPGSGPVDGDTGLEARHASAPPPAPGAWSAPASAAAQFAPAASGGPSATGASGTVGGPSATGAAGPFGGPSATDASGPFGAPAVPMPTAPSDWSTAPFADGSPQHPAPGRPTPPAVAPASPPAPAPGGAGVPVYEPAPPRQRVLAWPRYVDGAPLPALPDGTPDFSDVARG